MDLMDLWETMVHPDNQDQRVRMGPQEPLERVDSREVLELLDLEGSQEVRGPLEPQVNQGQQEQLGHRVPGASQDRLGPMVDQG